MIPKLVRDGNVAVIISPGHGAGWSTWSHDSEERLKVLFDPGMVDLLEHGRRDELENYVKLKYPDFYAGSIDRLIIEWIPEGTEFIVSEYDGFETIEFKDSMKWIKA